MRSRLLLSGESIWGSYLPDALIVSCKFLLDGRGRRQSRKQTQPEGISEISPQQQRLEFSRVQIQRLRQDRNSQELVAKTDLLDSELHRSLHQRGQRRSISPIRRNVIRNNSKVGGNALPEPRFRAEGMQVFEFDQVVVQQAGIIGDIAEANVKVPIHSLQRTNYDPVFGSGHTERIASKHRLSSALR